MQVERKLEDLGAVKSYRTIYGRQQIGIRPVVSSWGTINGWLRTINTIHKQFRPFDRINTRVNVAGKALHGLVHAFFSDFLFGWRVYLWVELKKGVSFLECIISWIWLEMRFASFSRESDSSKHLKGQLWPPLRHVFAYSCPTRMYPPQTVSWPDDPV